MDEAHKMIRKEESRLLNEVEKLTRKIFDHMGTVLPFVVACEGEEIAIKHVTDFMQNKALLCKFIEEMKKEFHVVFFISEAWAIERTQKKTPPEIIPAPYPIPSECADRVEQLVIMAYFPTGMQLSRANLNEGKNGNRTLSEWNRPNINIIDGALIPGTGE
jgi:uncharacterized membrane protein